MDWININFIHNGKSLLPISNTISMISVNKISKNELIQNLQSADLRDYFYVDIIKTFNGRNNDFLNIHEFKNELKKHTKYNKEFKNLGCRGFSYIMHNDIDIGCKSLLHDINYGVALMPNETLYYPPRIRRYLRRIMINHYKYNEYPSICFAIGKLVGKSCFIFVLQSDIVFRTPSFIRDHFRGWRKVLLKSIISSIKDKCQSIYLPLSKDVLKCSHPFQMPKRLPLVWEKIYDQTAKEFGFELMELNEPVNIQIYENINPIYVTKMNKLEINKNHEIY